MHYHTSFNPFMLSSNLAGYYGHNVPISELGTAPDYGVSPYLPEPPLTLSLAAVDLSRQTSSNPLPSNHEGQTMNTCSATTLPILGSSNERKPFVTNERRRAQNRVAQRAFRERKEQISRDLAQKLTSLEEKHEQLIQAHSALRLAYETLKKVIEILVSGDRYVDESSHTINEIANADIFASLSMPEGELEPYIGIKCKSDELVSS